MVYKYHLVVEGEKGEVVYSFLRGCGIPPVHICKRELTNGDYLMIVYSRNNLSSLVSGFRAGGLVKSLKREKLN